MSHYFDQNPRIETDRREIKFRYCDHDFRFISDLGVFSKDKVDEGTSVLLNTLASIPLKKDVLDMGCGIGVIAICLNKCFGVNVDAVDINERALALTKENVAINLANVSVYSSDKYGSVSKQFDEIVINPPIRAGKEVIYKMFKGAKNHLKDNGRLWIVIRKSHGAKSAKKYLEAHYNNVELVNRAKGYYVYMALDDLIK